MNIFLKFAFSFSFIVFNAKVYGQDYRVINPFDSLIVSNVKAEGNIKTGIVKISMDFKNEYSKTSKVYLSLGGFSDLGIQDNKGRKYKIYTDDKLINTSGINKGFIPVSSVQFGDKKFDWLTYLQQYLNTGSEKQLEVKIKKLDKATETIGDFHIRCILSLDEMFFGDKIYKIENLKIDWKN